VEEGDEKEEEEEEMFMYSRIRMVGGGRREVYPLELRIAVIGEPFFIRIKIKIKTFSIC
jgi:hypothetical protein